MRFKNKKLIYCFIIALVFLLICTKSSPLYVLNDWYDANAFFTMGKGMLNGKVPYLDLFEQKGPLLYLIYAIASLISSHSFIGVFIIEVIFFTIFLYYAFKIIELFLKEETGYILIPILTVLITASRPFTHGGSCEELCYPFLMIAAFHFIKYLKTNKLSNKQTLLFGITAGCIFWMKYTLIGFHFGIYITILIKNIVNKDFKNLITKTFYFLLGVIITTIPWLIYFAINNSIIEMINTYFLFNITSYANKISISAKISNFLITIKGVLLKYYQYTFLIIVPIIISIKSKVLFKKRIDNILLLLACLLLLSFIFIGGTNFRYYSLLMQPLMVIGMIIWIKICTLYKEEKTEKKKLYIIVGLTLISCFLYIPLRSPNLEYLSKTKKDYAQFQFAEIINKKKDAKILNYDFLDGGFYLVADVLPNLRFFQRLNVNYEQYPEILDGQRNYIKEKKADFIITRNKLNDKDKIIFENYTLVKSVRQKYEDKYRTYHLYEKKD